MSKRTNNVEQQNWSFAKKRRMQFGQKMVVFMKRNLRLAINLENKVTEFISRK